jgi:DNA-binding response OmpR family regulator
MTEKICIVEDDGGIQDILKIILEKAGYLTAIFPGGEAIMTNDYERPDVFLLDKQLPGIDGLDICKHLKSQDETREIPVIMISANPNIAHLARDAGADDFVEKPFTSAELLGTIETQIKKVIANKSFDNVFLINSLEDQG